ncbi:MAG: NAD+ synthase [Alphaproteobacteria bacterium]|nr:NAD+ synthase [Alphaproteobacteria bacterium]
MDLDTKTIKITCAQLNPTVGEIAGNAQHMLELWKEHDQDCDLIIFPELFLCGYPPEDLVLNASFSDAVRNKVEEICATSQLFQSAALIPTIWKENGRLYNAAILIEKGEIRHIFYKHMLPNNHVFDEPRTFASGPLPEPYIFRGYALGIMICEDVWYAEVPRYLKNNGAQILIAVNGSPFHVYQENERKEVTNKAIEETGLDLVYLNMVGGQDELVFDGRSFVIKKDFSEIYNAPAFEEDVFSIILRSVSGEEGALPKLTIADNKTSAQALNPTELLYKALVTGVRDYAYKNGFKDAILGLSGGIDSALTLAIAVDAFGSEHVRCVMLPSEFTSDESIKDAQKCIKLLNVSCETIPIFNAVEAFKQTIPGLSGVAHENTQSRIRGTILMALSNMAGALLLTTGNKSEVAVGYCTLYGDMNGGFNALKDVYKTDVYKLAEWRNTQSQVIPDNILTKAPTAELRANQKDEDSLPPYDLLDDILRLLIDYDNVDWISAPQDLLDIRDKCLQHPQDIEKIARLLKNTEYKRFQAAPGTRISFRGFGRDRRYPLTNHFVNKIEKS